MSCWSFSQLCNQEMGVGLLALTTVLLLSQTEVGVNPAAYQWGSTHQLTYLNGILSELEWSAAFHSSKCAQ